MSHLTKQQSTFDKELLKTKILTQDDYRIIVKETYKYFSINAAVVCFYNGVDWSIILLADMLAYPVLYFNFWSEKDETMYENTLVVCPITIRSMIYKGKIKILDVIDNRLYLLNTDTGDEFFMDLPYTGHYDDQGVEKKIKSQVKRHEVKILLLRDVFTSVLDPKYMIVNEKNRTIIYDGYYSNRYTHLGFPIHTTFHPKTIVYMVQYHSYKINAYRYTVIVGNDINKENVTGYNYKTSGIGEFMDQHKQMFIKKRAYIYPIFWFMVDVLYRDVKTIYITSR
jgi:hypothetical protein